MFDKSEYLLAFVVQKKVRQRGSSIHESVGYLNT